MFFTNMKVSTRLAAGFTIVVFLLIGVAYLGITRLGALNQSTESIVKNRYPVVAGANTVLNDLAEISISMRNILIMDDPNEIRKQLDHIEAKKGNARKTVEEIGNLVQSEKGKATFRAIEAARMQYVSGQEAFLKLVRDDKRQEAKALLVSKVVAEQQAYINELKTLIKLGAMLMDKGGEEARETYQSGATIILTLAGVAILIAGVFAYWVTRSITRPLSEAVQIARTVASGDLSSRIKPKSKNETGELLQALKDMNDSLLRIVGQVRTGADSITIASSQIAAGNLDLSSRTEEQASSLEETASSMEEMTSAVKQNADNAREANRLAVVASDVARKGGVVVSEVVGTMASINESSKKIVDIIGVIDGIAFQTNILALNAAVEAARAGEQGRGFAVVATEVRNLAQRSAAAAKEIKTLINDSVDRVHTGAKLVGQAGTTMEEIVGCVKSVTDIMSEIMAASQEQTTGIEQINQAISQMDQTTQQNASLVEEAAAASETMREEAVNLAKVVSTFKLDSAQVAATGLAISAKRGAWATSAEPKRIGYIQPVIAD
jgi:methyl-accepting chemotaxis protein